MPARLECSQPQVDTETERPSARLGDAILITYRLAEPWVLGPEDSYRPP